MFSHRGTFRHKTVSRPNLFLSRLIPSGGLPRLAGVCAMLLASALILAAGNAPTHPQAPNSYGKLPLSFEPNRGQTDKQVKFMARGAGYTLFLTPTEAVFSLQHNGAQAGVSQELADSILNPPKPAQQSSSVLRVQ